MTCPRCGEVVLGGSTFCPSCGEIFRERLEGPRATIECPTCTVSNPTGTNFCFACGGRLSDVRPSKAAAFGTASPRLVTVRRDGTDGPAFPIVGTQFDIGRSEGDLLFDDPHMATRHARIAYLDGVYELSPLETRNGVYVQVKDAIELHDGDHVLLGKQVLRFEVPNDAERIARPAVEHGVVLFGTPVKSAWGRLRQLTSAGTTRDMYHLYRADVVLGREQGDIVFSDDEFLSRRHAQLQQRGGRVSLQDLGSSNGTFVRLRGPHTLTQGALIRLGDELLRFEIG